MLYVCRLSEAVSLEQYVEKSSGKKNLLVVH